MFRILSRPYPRENNLRKGIRTTFLSGLIVFVFLWIFRPFNIGFAPVENLDLFIFGYGAVTVLIVFLFFPLPYIFKNYFLEENWTIGKNILFFLFLTFMIGFGNLLYTHVTTGIILSAGSFIAFELYALAVGFIVAALFTFINYFRKLKLNEADAKIMDSEVHTISKPASEKILRIKSENAKESLEIPDRSLLYIESADNYSKICFRDGDKTSMTILRNSLKGIEDQIEHPFVFRCHRSFIVNLMNVESVSGNSQGYRLHIYGLHETIPVARRTGSELHEKLNHLKSSKF